LQRLSASFDSMKRRLRRSSRRWPPRLARKRIWRGKEPETCAPPRDAEKILGSDLDRGIDNKATDLIHSGLQWHHVRWLREMTPAELRGKYARREPTIDSIQVAEIRVACGPPRMAQGEGPGLSASIRLSRSEQPLRAAPRADPYVRDYRLRLSPRMMTITPHVGTRFRCAVSCAPSSPRDPVPGVVSGPITTARRSPR
jgi:hypothetical protein